MYFIYENHIVLLFESTFIADASLAVLHTSLCLKSYDCRCKAKIPTQISKVVIFNDIYILRNVYIYSEP
jgi:hypothetical protein